MSNYSKIFNNKLNSIPRGNNNKIPKRENMNNCLTNIERKKDNKYIIESIKQENEDLTEIKNRCNTIEINNKNNSGYIYNKPNIIIKMNKVLSNRTIERPGSATPIYKRAKKIKSGDLYMDNIPISNSFVNNKNKENNNIIANNRIPKIIINSPIIMNKRKLNQEKEGNNLLNKLNKYFSYEKNTYIKDNNNILYKIPSSTNSNNKNNENKYMKKINIKSYKQKIKALQNDNFYEKREKYGKIYEREKKEEKERNKKRKGNEILLTNKSNEFVKRIRPINIREGNQILNYYLSPKNNKSQIFNNFYSINLPAPVKVINVFKK